MPTTFDSIDSVTAAVGADLGHTRWVTMTQRRIDRFADATDDHQWIHVNTARAAQGPFGACVAHGYLTLGMANKFLPELVRYGHLKMGVNYGCEKVRFPAPVKAGTRIRGSGVVIAAEPVKGDGVQVTVRITVEIEGSDKPGCVVDTISRLYFDSRGSS